MWSLLHLLNDDDCVIEVLNVGASLGGGTPPYQGLLDAGRARLTGFEPDPPELARLQAVYGEPHRFLPHFIGNGADAVYHQTNRPHTGSLFAPNTALLERFGNLASLTMPIAGHRMPTTRLDDIDLGNVDFIKIDVQGAELDVFRHGRAVLGQALLIQTKVSFVESHKGQPMFSDVDAFLRGSGFQYHAMAGKGLCPFSPLANPRHPLEAFRQEIWGDALYVRDWMNLDAIPTAKLTPYAVLLHDVVQSCDLAHVVLAERDRRTGGTAAPRYAVALMRGGWAEIRPRDTDFGFGAAPAAAVAVRGPELQPAAEPVPQEPLLLETGSGDTVAVPASLSCTTTYVLLEQERWFEKEVTFAERCIEAGTTAIDIGANVGLYTLALGRGTGEGGRVFAYEPGGDNRRLLQQTMDLNGRRNVAVLPQALSDSGRRGWLRPGPSGELHSLVAAGRDEDDGESVEVTTLDEQAAIHQWQSVDFVKMDAEGQEARIVVGGRQFLERFSPLVMYEVAHDASRHEDLRWIFAALGYGTYRLLGDASMLVPLGSDEAIAEFELNLFAAKPDRAQRLAERGLLAPAAGPFALAPAERDAALRGMVEQEFARSMEISRADIEACPFADALAAYSAYRFLDALTPARRHSALVAAHAQLSNHCRGNNDPAALSTLGRVALDLGRRAEAVEVLTRLAGLTDASLDQPFYPGSPRYDALPAGEPLEAWFRAAAAERLELSRTFSATYGCDLGRLRWLCADAPPSAEILRRTILAGTLQGMKQKEIGGLLARLADVQTRNRSVWRPDGAGLAALG